MQQPYPLTIQHIALATLDIFDESGINQQHFDPFGFQNLKRSDPVHSCGFHRYCLDATPFQPLRHLVQVRREGPEPPNCFRILAAHIDPNLLRSYIHACGIGSDLRQSFVISNDWFPPVFSHIL